MRKVDALNDEGEALKGAGAGSGGDVQEDIDDLRESPALEIIRLLQEQGADVGYHDLSCAVIADDGHTRSRAGP